MGLDTRRVTINLKHAKIDLDILANEAAIALGTDAGWTTASTIYTAGLSSFKDKTTTPKKMRFLADMGLKTGEAFGKLYTTYDTATGISPHKVVAAALAGGTAGTNSAVLVNFTTGTHANTKDFRKELIKKTLKFQVLQLYALHEIEAAVVKYKAGNSATKALDEWWVFYAGSTESGTANGAGPYILPEKRDAFFGTATATMGNGGKSNVNDMLMKATKEVNALIADPTVRANDAKLDKMLKCVRGQLKVALIQGCLQYAYKTDTTTAWPGSNSAKSKGELWAFCSGVLPFLHEANAASAATLKAATDIAVIGNANPSFTTINGVFTAANLNLMGVSCADIGAFVASTTVGKAVTAADHPLCTDGTIVNADADTSQCIFEGLTASPCPAAATAAAATTTPAPSAAIGTRPSMALAMVAVVLSAAGLIR